MDDALARKHPASENDFSRAGVTASPVRMIDLRGGRYGWHPATIALSGALAPARCDEVAA